MVDDDPSPFVRVCVCASNLGLRAGDECPRLSSSQAVKTSMLYRFSMHVRIPSRGQNGWNGAPFSVLPLDKLCRLAEEDARPMVDDGPLPLARVCVCAILTCLACQAVTGLQ